MASKLPLVRLASKDFGSLLLRALVKFCGASTSIGAFVGLMGLYRVLEDELLGIAILAGLTVGGLPAWRGVSLSRV